ncbi:MAG: T9SS type A sorting domain-containing protein, partial [Candidatus Marinimicrobia bacterium]|nr:T9SS type A sorting domain-containing protein [Candidatus Neomarinimicrobiota bacterium]
AAAIMVDSTYKLAFLAFPFEAIKYDDDRAELMDRIMNWFDGEIDFEHNDLFRYKLRQNYPNPFNNHTTIQYSLSENSNVAINIYNLQGQLVETLKRNHQKAGSYAVTWDATGCPSGVYFYQIKAGNYVKTKKCVYVK